MTRAWIGLGGNLGNPRSRLSQALADIAALPDTKLVAVSPAYWTRPWGEPEQAEFLNAVAGVDTGLAPRGLLEALLEIERDAGRVRTEHRRWQPRVLDLDLLVYGDLQVTEPGLHIPHPRLAERAFVLVPFNDVAPDLQVPGHGRVSELLGSVDHSGVRAAGLLEPGRFDRAGANQ